MSTIKENNGNQTTLEERIKKAEKAISNYPLWVQKNMVFQGGLKRGEENNDYRSYGNY